jgi:hypothetical protein
MDKKLFSEKKFCNIDIFYHRKQSQGFI